MSAPYGDELIEQAIQQGRYEGPLKGRKSRATTQKSQAISPTELHDVDGQCRRNHVDVHKIADADENLDQTPGMRFKLCTHRKKSTTS